MFLFHSFCLKKLQKNQPTRIEVVYDIPIDSHQYFLMKFADLALDAMKNRPPTYCQYLMSQQSVAEIVLLAMFALLFAALICCYGFVLRSFIYFADISLRKTVAAVLATCLLHGAMIVWLVIYLNFQIFKFSRFFFKFYSSWVPILAFNFAMTFLKEVPSIPMDWAYFYTSYILDTIFSSYQIISALICIYTFNGVKKVLLTRRHRGSDSSHESGGLQNLAMASESSILYCIDTRKKGPRVWCERRPVVAIEQ